MGAKDAQIMGLFFMAINGVLLAVSAVVFRLSWKRRQTFLMFALMIAAGMMTLLFGGCTLLWVGTTFFS